MQRNGCCKWMGTPIKDDLTDGTALLRITTNKGAEALYWVYHGERETRLKKKDGTVYACNLQTGWCECSDHQQRNVTCKHVKALRAALPKID